MNLTLRILNGEFVIYDHDLKKYLELNKKISKEDLKQKIVEIIKIQKKPIKVRNVIYMALSLISGYEVKKYSKFVILQEKTDPLFLELYDFVINLDEYKKLIQASRALKISENKFTVSDVNGIVYTKTNDEIDVEKLNSKIKSSIHYTYYGDISFFKTLKHVFFEYFDVSKCGFDYSNPIVKDTLEIITESIYKKIIFFKEGKICIRVKNTFYPPELHITVESLKEQILTYISKNPKVVKKHKIIFDSLEILSGYQSMRNVSKYLPTTINGVRREILVEDPLYVELCDFIEKLPQYQINKKQSIEEKRIMVETMKKANILEREQRFVEHSWIYNENRHRNLYQDY